MTQTRQILWNVFQHTYSTPAYFCGNIKQFRYILDSYSKLLEETLNLMSVYNLSTVKFNFRRTFVCNYPQRIWGNAPI